MHTFNLGQVPPMTFGSGRLAKVPRLVKGLGGGPVLIVADAALAELGLTRGLTAKLEAGGIASELAADVAGEPKISLVEDLRVRARSIGAQVVIAMGGGAAMDAAKVVAVLAGSKAPAGDYELAAQPLPQTGLATIAIPTTAGTGSEVTRTAVISRDDGRKTWFWGDELIYSQAVLDPDLTLSLPPHLTAWTGIDAVAHALEGSTARATTPVSQMFGLEALRILSDALPRSVEDGAVVEIRGRVLWASMIAGLSLNNCNMHLGHTLSHALGSLVRIHHGMATGLGLEVSLPWLVARPEGGANYARAAQALGGPAEAEALPRVFADLMRTCGIEAALPVECAAISAATLATEMKDAANIGMAKNAASPLDDGDYEHLASRMLALPIHATANA